MKVKITDNLIMLSLKLTAAQQRATERIVTPQKIAEIVKKTEEYLETICLPKKHWTGTVVEYIERVNCDNYGKKGSYRAPSTKVVIEKGRTCWFLTECERLHFPTGKTKDKDANLYLTTEAEEFLKRKYIRNIESEFFARD